MKNIIGILALGALLAACATPPRNVEAGNAGSAVAASQMLGACPRHLKIKDDQRAYYNNRLSEGRRLLGDSKSRAYYTLMGMLKEPGACERFSNGNFVANNIFLAKR